jgi:hypothetical protein
VHEHRGRGIGKLIPDQGIALCFGGFDLFNDQFDAIELAKDLSLDMVRQRPAIAYPFGKSKLESP